MTPEPKSSAVAPSSSRSPIASAAHSPIAPMTPTCTSAPTSTKSAMKKARVSHSTSSRNSSGSVRETSTDRAGAHHRDDRRVEVEHGVEAEGDHHEEQHDQGAAQHPHVGDRVGRAEVVEAVDVAS